MADFVNNLLGTNLSDGVALAVLAGIVLLAILVLWFLSKAIRQPGFAGRRGKNARIAITDATRIDDRRRLVLVRRDDVEHLLLIGGANDVLVETDIKRTAPDRERVEMAQIPARPAVAPKAVEDTKPPEPKVEPPQAAPPKPAPVPRQEPVQAPRPEPAPAVDPAAAKPVPKPETVDDINSLLKDFSAKRN